MLRGDEWKDIKKVIGVNILGGGKDNRVHWSDAPGHFVRHYKFEDQLDGKGRFIDGMELIQYSVMKTPREKLSQEQQDWITFFKEAHLMSEEEVRVRIKTPGVLQAFERARISALPAMVREKYEAEDKEYDRYSQHTDELVSKSKAEGEAKGRAEGEKAKAVEMARKLLRRGRLIKEIAEDSGLTEEEIRSL